jgi:uncharacterized protein (DUF427 family)
MSEAKDPAEPAYRSLLSGPMVEKTSRWVRVKFGGEFVADSRRALLLRQYGPGRLPTYFFPKTDIRLEYLDPGNRPDPQDEVKFWDVRVGNQVAENGAWTFKEPVEDLSALRDHLSFSWRKMEGWFEEEEQVFVHARDPYKRVDIIESSRHVRVVVEGHTIAESRRPFVLFETHLPTRYYLPPDDVRMDLLTPSPLITRCPYKGTASYWSLRVGGREWPDIVWSYPDPIPENPKIRGLMCFFNEQVDLYIDGELQERPLTPWS